MPLQETFKHSKAGLTQSLWAAQFPECTTRAQSQVCLESPLGSGSQAVVLLADVNHPGYQEDMVSNWEPAHRLVENAVSEAEIGAAYCLQALAVTSLPLCLQWWGGPCMHLASSPLVFTQCFVL